MLQDVAKKLGGILLPAGRGHAPYWRKCGERPCPENKIKFQDAEKCFLFFLEKLQKKLENHPYTPAGANSWVQVMHCCNKELFFKGKNTKFLGI